ncbi:hypothetical protein [Methanopyrus kandleri]
MRLHVLLTLGDVSNYQKPKEPWLVEASLLERLAGEPPGDTLEWTVEGREVEVVETSDRELGTLALLEALHDGFDVEPGEAVVVSTRIIEEDEKREKYEEKVREPLEDLEYGVEEYTDARLTEPEGLVDRVCEAALELLRTGDAVLFDLTHGARVMPFASALGLVPALRALTFRRAVLGDDEGSLWERVAFSYCISGKEVEGVVEGDRWLVADVTDHVLAWRARDAVATYLADPSPRWVDEAGEALRTIRSEPVEWVETLREFARVERASSPGPVHEFVREEDVPDRDSLVELVWRTLRRVFSGNMEPREPVRRTVSEGPLTPEERRELAARLSEVRDFLREYCRYMLDRGRVTEAASLMNETHLLLRAFAKLVEPFLNEGAYKRARLKRSDGELRRLKELAAATLDELYFKLFDPFEGLPAARGAIRRILGELGEDVGESTETVWESWSRSGELLRSLVGGGLPLKRDLEERLGDAFRDDPRLRELAELSGTDDPTELALEKPPIRRIRNKLQHGDPVLDRREVHRRLVELCRAHLERLTLPLIELLTETVEGRTRGDGPARGS